MTRRTAFKLTAMTLGLAAAALPQASFAQSDPQAGLWQLNLSKTKYISGMPPKSLTAYVQGEGQNRKLTEVGISADGSPAVFVFTYIYDGMPHPVTGTSLFDAVSFTRVDDYTDNYILMKDGKAVETGTEVVSQGGKTWTVTYTRTNANGQKLNGIQVFDRQ